MGEGCQVNIDRGEATVFSGIIVDCIFNPCTTLSISFATDHKCTFTPNGSSYFTYSQIDWIAEVYDESMSTEEQYVYNVVALPKEAYRMVNTVYSDVASLAQAVGLSIMPGNRNMTFPIAPLNFCFTQTLQMQELYSFEENYNRKNIGESKILYFNSQSLFCETLNGIKKKKAKELTVPNLFRGMSLNKYVDDRVRNLLSSHITPEKWTLMDYFKRIFHNKFDIVGPNNYIFLDTYTIAFQDDRGFNLPGQYILIRNEMNITEADKSICTFAKLNDF